jgi:polyphosphate kinase 2 (PPK2 family)
MFEAAELGNKLDKRGYKKEAPVVREALLGAQRRLATSELSLVIIVAGIEGSGKGETVNLLLEWLDARGIKTHAMREASDEERERPTLWQFWRRLPPSGRTAIFFGGWYQDLLLARVRRRVDHTQFTLALERIEDFERMLSREHVLVVKFWLHLSKDGQKTRFKKLERDRDTRWRVTKQDWKLYKRYDEIRHFAEQALRKTSIADAPWHVVEAFDSRYRHLTVTKTLLQTLQERLARSGPQAPKTIRKLPVPKPKNVLSQLDLRKRLSDKAYQSRLPKIHSRLNLLSRRLAKSPRSMILVFEGPDAAGKGGTIRRLTPAMDARAYQVITIAERLEGFAATGDWQRAYEEINAFEEQLTDFGVIILKFWLEISSAEQLRRFKERRITPYKHYKLTEEDWRNRKKWQGYEAAACDMIERTSTENAPWVLVEANDKNYARIKVLETICRRLEARLER